MSDAPHVLLVTYERLILWPISLCSLVAAGLYFRYGHWKFGLFLLLICLLVGMIGQGLPHRKKQTNRELVRQDVQCRYGKLREDESFAFAKAFGKGAFLVTSLALATAFRNHLSWGWIVGYALGGWVGFFVLTIPICFGWAWIMEKLFSSRQTSSS